MKQILTTLADSWRIYRRHFTVLALLALAWAIPMGLVSACFPALQGGAFSHPHAKPELMPFVWLFLAFLWQVVPLAALLTFILRRDDPTHGLSQAWSAGFRNWWRMIWTGVAMFLIILAFALCAGILLSITVGIVASVMGTGKTPPPVTAMIILFGLVIGLPVLYFSIRTYFSGIIVMAEGEWGFRALWRSVKLTRRCFWLIFFFVLICNGIPAVLMNVATRFLAPLYVNHGWLVLVVTMVFSVIWAFLIIAKVRFFEVLKARAVE